MRAATAFRKPRRLSFAAAAQLLLPALTACAAMRAAGIVDAEGKGQRFASGCMPGEPCAVDKPLGKERNAWRICQHLKMRASGTEGYAGPPVDLWSAGICLFALLCGKMPFAIADATCLRNVDLGTTCRTGGTDRLGGNGSRKATLPSDSRLASNERSIHSRLRLKCKLRATPVWSLTMPHGR